MKVRITRYDTGEEPLFMIIPTIGFSFEIGHLWLVIHSCIILGKTRIVHDIAVRYRFWS